VQPIKWHGGKNYLAKWIVSLMPPRCKNPNAPTPADRGWLHYVEPYAGGLAVLLAQDPAGISEVVNDLNRDLSNFWGILGDPDAFTDFCRMAEATPFSEVCYESAERHLGGGHELLPHQRAWAFFVRCRQSLAGRMDCFAPLSKSRARRGMNEQASAWLGAVDGLLAVHRRMRRVVVLCRDALAVIRQQDGPRTLFYLDPPYLHETRASTGEYDHEMTEAQHRELLETLACLSGRFLLSGYPSALYDSFAKANKWKCHAQRISNHAAGGSGKRVMTECVWTNF
jgi:DNA adenine methylase